MAFLSLITGKYVAYKVIILHQLLHYMDLPGDDPTGQHNRVLGLVGDIMPPHQYYLTTLVRFAPWVWPSTL
jgi:hypothetical protein